VPAGRAGRGRRRLWTGAALAVLGLAATACDVPNFGFPDGVTNQSPRILNLWQGSSIAALAVGVFVWGLIFYAIIVFRKRTDELPRQIRYNLPVEVLYTLVPVVIISGLMWFTGRDEIQIDKLSDHPDVAVEVVGFRWQWQFRYIHPGTPDDNGVPIEVTGRPGEPPVLVLPQNRTIRFAETSPDVIHSFWVPDFLFKRDVVPGRVNQFELSVTKTGTFIGRCAELCGADHDRMIFYVRVVPEDEYDRFISERQHAVPAQVAAPAGATNVITPTTVGRGQ
jgi:cytochrome c oxidase subunit 2